MIAIKLILIGMGVGFLILSLLSFVTKKISPGMGVLWVLASILLIVLGFLPVWRRWMQLVSLQVTITFFVLVAVFLIGLFLVCLTISNLLSRNRELAMQVSLLNQENEQMLKDLEELENKTKGVEPAKEQSA